MAWESPSDEDSELITHAHRDVYGDADWINPFQLSEPLQTCWAVENAQGIIDNGGLQYFFDSDWDGNSPYSFFIQYNDWIANKTWLQPRYVNHEWQVRMSVTEAIY
jgi:hypothetical protein